MDYLAKKYAITSEAAQILCKEAGLTSKHICDEGVYKIGLMELGKHVKKNPIIGKPPPPDDDGKIIEMLQVCKKPANPLKLRVCRENKYNNITCEEDMMVCNVHRRVHAGIKIGTVIRCERISEGLYAHPPYGENP